MSKINQIGIILLVVTLSFLTNSFTTQAESSHKNQVKFSSLASNPQCDSNVPYYFVDLTDAADSSWLSPNVGRLGNCCGTTHPDRCISFTVVLDKNAVGLEFSIAEGAIPSGSLFYQVDCGPQTIVGEGVCLEGGKAYEVTFCKPGANKNVYQIRSIPGIIIPDEVSTRKNCPVSIEISGVDESTIVWNDITGGGTYNSYLACTSNCLINTVTPDEFAPSTILYEVCGDAIDETCGGIFNVCDTVVVHIYPEIEVTISGDLTFCSGSASSLLATAIPISAGYVYSWYDNYNATGNLVSTADTYEPNLSGQYSVVAYDPTSPLGCSYDTLNFDVVTQDCIPQCPTATVCPDGSVSFNTVSDFTSAGGSINFPCPVDDGNIQLINTSSDANSCPEIITQTYEIWDNCGNRAPCGTQIIRTDTEVPILTGIPGDITILCASPPAPPIIYTDITASDNCDSDVEITLTETSTQTFDNSYTSVIYQIVRTWTATDDCGNSISQTQTINAICEYCHNGIDDDGDGAVDEADPDCPCTAPNFRLSCENIQYYYVPPVWQMNPLNVTHGADGYVNPSSLVISTPFGSANVNIRTADGTTINQTLTINQGTAEVIPLNYNQIQTPNYNSIENDKGLIIESDQLIQIIYRIDAVYNKMLVTIKGEQALGTRFRAGSQTNVCGSPDTFKRENHFISVMAVEDNTTVQFEFTADMKDLGSQHNISLNAGESYLVIDNDINQTVSGSLINSDKPIAVISGSQHSQQCSDHGRDAGIDQLIPACGIGSKYVITRGQDDDFISPANYAVIVAVTSNTNVFINGSATSVATLNPGEYYTYDMPGPNYSRHYIETSNPAYLYQFGSVQNNGEIGMAIAAPIDGCRGDRFIEFFRFPNSLINSVTTLIPNSGLSSLTLNGNPYTDYAIAESIPGLASWSSVTFKGGNLNDYNVLQSDALFNASQFVGNTLSGTFGYLTSFKDKIFVYDPISGDPTYNYFTDTICAGSPYSHCINSSSCSGSQFITSIIGSSHTSSYTITPKSTCFEYTPSIGYNGMDTITVLLSDDFGFTQAVCISFYICGTEPLISGTTDSVANCTISEIPIYTDFNDFLTDGGSASDDCSGLDVTSFGLISEISDGNSCPETIIRTYEISNTCGLSSTFTQTIVIDNNNKPELSGVPADITVNCNEVPSPPTIGIDLIGTSFCGITPMITFDELRSDESCPNRYQLTRTWTVTDECGNDSTDQQVITVIDTIPPTASNLAPVSIQCRSDLPAPNVSLITDGVDNCTSPVLISYIDDVSDGNTCPETITRSYAVSDECGNSSQVIQLIIISDNTDPLISCIPDLIASSVMTIPPSASSFNQFMSEGGSASDNCELDSTSFILLSETTSNISGNDILTRSYQITDLCGNSASCDQLITIGAPTTDFDDPTDTWIECIDKLPSQISTFQELIDNGGNASSTCGIDTTTLSLVNEISDGNTCPQIINRTYQIADSCGNIITLTHQITIDDITTPSINCLADTIVSGIALVPPSVNDFNDFMTQGGTALDNCELDSTSFILVNEQTSSSGNNTTLQRTYQIADLCGNTVSCDQIINIIPPINTTSNPPDVIIECADELPSPIATYQELLNQGGSAFSSCGIDTTTLVLNSELSDGNTCPEIITRNYEITDSCGNSISLSQQITIDDQTNPTINCIPDSTINDISLLLPPANTLDEFILQGGTVSDNCELDSTSFILLNEVAGTSGRNSTITRSYHIADLCGNSTSCDQIITIIPNATTNDDPDDILIECIDDLPIPISSYQELIENGGSAFSTCGIDTTTLSFVNDLSDGNTCPEVITRSYEITDSCGNKNSLSHQIINDDITDPIIECIPDTTVYHISLVPPHAVNVNEFISKNGNVSDNCELDSTSFILLNEVAGISGGNDILTRTYQIADHCGNSSTCEQTITIEKPIIIASDPLSNQVNCIDYIPQTFNSFQEILDNGANASSSCGIDTTSLTLVSEISDGNTCPETISRTYEINDSCGNVLSISHQITIDDQIDPTLICPSDTTVHNDPLMPLPITTISEFIMSGGLADDNCELDSTSFMLINELSNKVGGNELITRIYQVSDLCGNIATCSHKINHTYDPNEAPIAQNDNYSGGQTIIGNVTDNDSDPDGDGLIVNTNPISQPIHGTLTLYPDGSFSYEFPANTAVLDSFIYEVCDDSYDPKCDQATVYITTFPDNDNDGIDDAIDIDDDDDGILDVIEGDGAIDSDNDGVPDSLDIDADNDGIVDNIEVQPEGEFIAPIGRDDNENGLDDAYEEGINLGIPPVDTDGDKTPDYLDLDSDNDGISDVIEGFDIGAKGIANKKPTDTDTDGDGYDDAFDGLQGGYDSGALDNPFGSTAALQDFDNDGWRDWRDVDDDNDGLLTRYEDLDNDGDYGNDDIDFDGHPEYLDARDECKLFIPEGFSPNEDGVHDFFQIYCIEKFPNAKLIIFDRWGNQLYEHERYGNMDFWGNYNEAWWNGTTTQNPEKKVRPETYLYILETTPGSSERGFVMVSY